MIISVKKSPNTLSKQKPLTLNGQTLQQVNTYKYLGVLISSDLKWSPHIAHVSLKARRILGALYHGCYSCHLNLSTAILLYKSMVRPHLEYSCHIWSPHTTRDIQALESVQNFALRVITKHWTHSYEELLSLTTLPTLEKGLYLRLQFLYKIVKILFFPHGLVTFRGPTRHNRRSSHPVPLEQPFARTNRLFLPFTPNTISSLHLDRVSAPNILSFKKELSLHLF